LFLLAGTMLNRYGSVDEITLHGRGRSARVVPWLFVIAGLARCDSWRSPRSPARRCCGRRRGSTAAAGNLASFAGSMQG
jgi:hypothetical protein